jgi:hypothetical protein
MSEVIKHCYTCDNQGFEDKVCPKCGREPLSLNLRVRTDKQLEEYIDHMRVVRVPEEYIGNEWSMEVFWRSHTDKLDDRGRPRNKILQHYVEVLDDIHAIFAEGRIPKASGIIISPNTFAKKVWAFSCMQHAIDRNYSVAPMLDTLELNRLVVLGAQDLKYKLYGEIDYDTYMMCDVMFITVTKTEYRKSAYSVLQEVFDRRSRKGLRTFVLSEYSIEDISSWDRSGNFIKMKKSLEGENKVKIPAIISFNGGLSAPTPKQA